MSKLAKISFTLSIIGIIFLFIINFLVFHMMNENTLIIFNLLIQVLAVVVLILNYFACKEIAQKHKTGIKRIKLSLLYPIFIFIGYPINIIYKYDTDMVLANPKYYFLIRILATILLTILVSKLINKLCNK